MPASSPSAGLDRRFFVSDRQLQNFGADSSVNYQVTAYNPKSDVVFVGGNNDYVGLMTDGIFGQLVQGNVLPLSSNTFVYGAVGHTSGFWFVIDSTNLVFRCPADLNSTATNITPPNVVTRQAIAEFQGQLLSQHNNQTIPQRQIEFSGDNGATWDSDPGIDTGQATNGNGLVTNIGEDTLIAIFTGGTNIALTTGGDPDPTLWGWSLIPCGNAGLPMNDVAIADAGGPWCVVSQNGDITTSGGIILPQNNPFKHSATAGTSIETVTWVQDLNGFILNSNIGPYMGFVSATDLTRCFAGSYMGNGVAILDAAGVSDGEQLLIPGSVEEALMSLRNVGQTGVKTA